MKKLFILFAAVALMAMTACNEKPAKNTDNTENAATEQVDSVKANDAQNGIERAKPTADGKDHTVAEFNTLEYQVRLENLADGTFRLSMWDLGNYLMRDDEGKSYIISAKSGSEQITIMTDKEIVYNGTAAK